MTGLVQIEVGPMLTI